MPSFHPRNGSSRLNGRRTKVASSPLLLKKCFQHPKAAKALFITILFSWVGFVALFLSKLPSSNRGNAISPLSTKVNLAKRLRSLSSSSHANDNDAIPPPIREKQAKKQRTMQKEGKKLESAKQSARDGVAAVLLSRLPQSQPQPNGHHHGRISPKENVANNLRAIRENWAKETHAKPKTLTKKELLRQSLDLSQPYEQSYTEVSSYVHLHVSAFAAEKYLDDADMMHDNDDSLDTYYALDDDAIRGNREEYHDKDQGFCTTPTFYRLYRPNCNELHSTVSGNEWLTGDEYMSNRHRSRYLGSGAYRQVFLLESFTSDEVVLKSMKRFQNDGNTLEERAAYDPEDVYHNFELYDDMRKDSMVMELLTSSPRIANIYAFCALSSMIEYAPGNIENYVMPTEGYETSKQDDDEVDPTPVNDHIPPQEKLEMALELAKGLAAMHGHSGGVIANVDVQIGQFCRGKDGLIKIVDGNRAEVLLYDMEHETYCSFSNGAPPDGSLRAPEEIIDAPLSEKIDVYSVGNVFYSILTGLLVNRNAKNIKEAHWRVTHGKTEEIDVSYFESRGLGALVKAIQWCWTFQAEERPSIFEIVNLLEDEVKKNLSSS
ncbi:hypothetical protein ACHAXR_006618 [Thalassiosira sp. AJA248-18]